MQMNILITHNPHHNLQKSDITCFLEASLKLAKKSFLAETKFKIG